MVSIMMIPGKDGQVEMGNRSQLRFGNAKMTMMTDGGTVCETWRYLIDERLCILEVYVDKCSRCGSSGITTRI